MEPEAESKVETEATQEVKTLLLEEYGSITKREEKVHSLINGEVVYYCEIEQFFFKSDYEWAQAESENYAYDEFYLTEDSIVFFRGQYPHFYEEI